MLRFQEYDTIKQFSWANQKWYWILDMFGGAFSKASVLGMPYISASIVVQLGN
jgi:preprotein translocase subunit SecY